jgi:hypothetical protein
MAKLIDISGKTFERLTVVGLSHLDKNKSSYWLCKCVCGKDKVINKSSLIQGKSKSCGCLNQTHGEGGFIQGSNLRNPTKEYSLWISIKGRCFNPKMKFFHRYGGRGITMCDRWKNSYEDFLEDVGRAPSSKHSLDRINVDGNYEPSNCKWATQKEQMNNTCRNRFIEWNGKKQTVIQWCEELNLNENKIRSRIKRNWDVSKIFV